MTAMMRKKVLRPDEILATWDLLRYIPVDLRKINMTSALKIAGKYNLYAYDAYFLECADRLRRPLLTLDGTMKRIAVKMGITVVEEP